MTKDQTSKLHDIIDRYEGTSDVLNEVDDSYLRDNNLHVEFDTRLFMCEECGWWCPDYEHSGDQICVDCNPA